jgi:lipoprotein-releasing system permease protein
MTTSDPSAPTPFRFDELPPVQGGSTYAAEWWIAWGHLRSKKSETFLSVVTTLSIVGVMAGVALLNCVIAVMTGFEVDLRNKILGANAHIVVFRHGGAFDDPEGAMSKILAVDGVDGAAPFVYAELMLRSDQGSTGVIVKGVDPARTGPVTHVRGDLVEGYTPSRSHAVSFGVGDLASRAAFIEGIHEPFPAVGLDRVAISTDLEAPLPGIIVGSELRDQLSVRVGDTVQVINPLGAGAGPMGMPTPSVRPMRVAGVFDSGMYEYDTKWTYMDNGVAQDFLRMNGAVTGIEVRVADIDAVDRITEVIDAELQYPYYARHWKNLNAKLFAALQLEKWVMGLLLNMIVVNAGLLIVTTLFMLVITKGREIAILKAMGASNASINRIFIMEGSVIGAFGTLSGTLLGLAGCAFLDGYQYPLETDVYYLDTLPVVVDPTTVFAIAVSAFVTCFLCTIYPAWRAANVDPVEALRYE